MKFFGHGIETFAIGSGDGEEEIWKISWAVEVCVALKPIYKFVLPRWKTRALCERKDGGKMKNNDINFCETKGDQRFSIATLFLRFALYNVYIPKKCHHSQNKLTFFVEIQGFDTVQWRYFYCEYPSRTVPYVLTTVLTLVVVTLTPLAIVRSSFLKSREFLSTRLLIFRPIGYELITRHCFVQYGYTTGRQGTNTRVRYTK